MPTSELPFNADMESQHATYDALHALPGSTPTGGGFVGQPPVDGPDQTEMPPKKLVTIVAEDLLLEGLKEHVRGLANRHECSVFGADVTFSIQTLRLTKLGASLGSQAHLIPEEEAIHEFQFGSRRHGDKAVLIAELVSSYEHESSGNPDEKAAEWRHSYPGATLLRLDPYKCNVDGIPSPEVWVDVSGQARIHLDPSRNDERFNAGQLGDMILPVKDILQAANPVKLKRGIQHQYWLHR